MSSFMVQASGFLGSWDKIPDAAGPFGSLQNPIPVNGPKGEIIYLNRLRSGTGKPFFYHRLGSLESGATGHPVDVFELASMDGSRWAFIVLSPYHPRRSTLPPPDMQLRPWPKDQFGQTMCRTPGFGMMQPVEDFPIRLPAALANSDYLNSISPGVGAALGRKVEELLGPDSSKWRRPIGHVPPDVHSLDDVLKIFMDNQD